MATAMVTLTWCDWHLSEKDEEVPAQAMPELDGMQLDLCEECATQVQAVLALYREHGSKGPRTITPPRRDKRSDQQPDAFPCPVDGCASVLRSRGSLGAHVRQYHGITVGEAEGKPIVASCPECGKGFTSKHGAALHQRAHPAKPARPARKRQRSAPAAEPASQ